jgi:tRNA threonylcarbamoyladenosine biosynthesis protein TsaE
VNHADLYRLGDEDELHATGFHDLVGRVGATVVEWADRFPGALPRERLEIRLDQLPGHPSARRLVISGYGERHAGLARTLAPRSRPGR